MVRIVLGALAMGSLVGCDLFEPKEQTWCGTFNGKESLFVLTTMLNQDMAGGERCYTLTSCGGTEYALALEPDGRCNVRVDFATPEEGIVRAGGKCERGTDRLSGRSRDLGTSIGGKVTRRDGKLEADIRWEVLIHTTSSRLGGTQDWTFREAARNDSRAQALSEDVCKVPPPDEPEDFSWVVGCAPEDIVPLDKTDAVRVVRFGGDLGKTYAPRCILIEAGQTVRFEGSFREYALSSGTPAEPTLGSPYNPIYFRTVGDSAQFTFSRPGDYIYSSPPFESQGMRGLIRVR